jgi:hypothetical protein
VSIKQPSSLVFSNQKCTHSSFSSCVLHVLLISTFFVQLSWQYCFMRSVDVSLLGCNAVWTKSANYFTIFKLIIMYFFCFCIPSSFLGARFPRVVIWYLQGVVFPQTRDHVPYVCLPRPFERTKQVTNVCSGSPCSNPCYTKHADLNLLGHIFRILWIQILPL